MATQTVIGLVGIVVVMGAVAAVLAAWRTGPPFPELTDPGVAPPPGPDCATCGHRAHRGHCSERTSASGDVYDGAGDWVGHRNETSCDCSAYRTEPWPPCTVCGHGRSGHHMLLRCRHVQDHRNESACPCGGYRAGPGPKPSYYLEALRAQARRRHDRG
ncbi:hypothetical protein [Kitasatospora sp. NPDC093679]|uniref:hypothetical protein n=1 Tax=Kitasatospora sp. NPDC093679 TaxID=3154983 RepID=UPI00342F493B